MKIYSLLIASDIYEELLASLYDDYAEKKINGSNINNAKGTAERKTARINPAIIRAVRDCANKDGLLLSTTDAENKVIFELKTKLYSEYSLTKRA